MLTERDFVTNEWVGCGGLHMVPLIQQLVTGEAPRRVLDMGCGCGAIGIALLHEWLVSELVLVDIDEQSVDFACRNAARLLPEANVSCYVADVFWNDADKPVIHQPVDLIVCNPPLTAVVDVASVPSTWNPLRVLSFENNFQLKLFAGLDKHLVPGGLVVIKDLVTNNWFDGFSSMQLQRTLIGNERTLQTSTTFTDLADQPTLPGQHCLRLFRRAG